MHIKNAKGACCFHGNNGHAKVPKCVHYTYIAYLLISCTAVQLRWSNLPQSEHLHGLIISWMWCYDVSICQAPATQWHRNRFQNKGYFIIPSSLSKFHTYSFWSASNILAKHHPIIKQVFSH